MKINIQQAALILEANGYKLATAPYDMARRSAMYVITNIATGQESTLPVKDIIPILRLWKSALLPR